MTSFQQDQQGSLTRQPTSSATTEEFITIMEKTKAQRRTSEAGIRTMPLTTRSCVLVFLLSLSLACDCTSAFVPQSPPPQPPLCSSVATSTASFCRTRTIHSTASTTSLQMSWDDNNSSNNNWPDALATQGDWTAYLDAETTGLVYYFNGSTGESRWEPPTSDFPVIQLPRRVRRQAEQQRLQYIKQLQTQEEKAEFAARTALENNQAFAETPEKGAQESEKWFDFLFEEEEDEKKKKQQEEKEKSGWLSSVFSSTREEGPKVDDSSDQQGFFKRLTGPSAEEDKQLQADVPKRGLLDLLREPEVQPEEIETTPVEVPIQIEAASCVLPHPAKMFWGGEDAVFTAGRTFGVFDGVSGAEKLDGVPLYSKTLAAEMRKRSKVEQGADSGWTVPNLVASLAQAKQVADESATGASTAIVASITPDGFLRALNVGDSACLVVRNGQVAARTREILHYFDCPYQLSTDSPDQPRDGTRLNIELVRGDVIIMASDGVFDNLADSDILELVVEHLESSSSSISGNTRLSRLAKKISDQSRKVSLNRQAPTPYAKAAKRNGDPDFAEGKGGKLDDVSCVVVRYA